MAAQRRASSPLNPLGSLLFTLGIVALGILIYASTQLLTEPTPERWIGVPPPLSEEGGEVPLEERIAAVTARLETGVLRLGSPEVREQGSGKVRYQHRHYELVLPREDPDFLRSSLEQARADDPIVVVGVEDVEGGQRGEVGIDGLLTHTVAVRWLAQATPVPPRVAVVIDGMGNDLLSARDLMRLPFPVAVAVVPFRPFSREVAESAHRRGRDVLLCLPVEALDDDGGREAEVLRASDPPNQVIQVVDRSFANVPHVIGVTFPMGARFVEDPVGMRLVLERLRQRGLFLLDDGSAPRGAARRVAESLGVPEITRGLWLDQTVDEAAVRGQLQALVAAAKSGRTAVGIGHPHGATVAALRGFDETARREGVEIVALSTLLAQP